MLQGGEHNPAAGGRREGAVPGRARAVCGHNRVRRGAGEAQVHQEPSARRAVAQADMDQQAQSTHSTTTYKSTRRLLSLTYY